MATIRLRPTQGGKKRYQAIVRKRGHKLSRTFSTYAAAQSWSDQVEGEIAAGKYSDSEADKHTLSEAVEKLLQVGSGDWVPTHTEARRQQLERWIQFLGDVPLSHITPRRVAAGRDFFSQEYSAQTVNHHLHALGTLFDTAMREWYWVERNPVRAVKPRRLPPGRTRWLTIEEKDKLLEACRQHSDKRLYPLVVFTLTTGARQMEVMGLEWSRVNLNSHPATALLEKTKNRRKRVLTFAGTADRLIREMAKAPHISGYVFASRKLGKDIDKVTFPHTAWKEVKEAAGLSDFRFHDLRHTAASYLAMSGATVPEIADFLGTTFQSAQRYAHLCDQHAGRVTVRMAEQFLT